jgi:hypothetical protein
MTHPDADPTTLEVPLYPRSAHLLQVYVSMATDVARYDQEPPYVQIDLANFRNQLLAHLERVAVGD